MKPNHAHCRIRNTLICLTLGILTLISCTACRNKKEYTPTGEFYVKTSPARGDAGVRDVISLEADHQTYEGDGDITVSMTVGLGHLPDAGGYGDDVQDIFYVLYRIIEAPWEVDKEPAWEKKVEYTDSWYDSKYDSTKQKNPPSLIFPHYGEFYPLYKETVEIVFPAGVEKGWFQVKVYSVIEGHEDHQQQAGLEFYFDRVDGVLKLAPRTRS